MSALNRNAPCGSAFKQAEVPFAAVPWQMPAPRGAIIARSAIVARVQA